MQTVFPTLRILSYDAAVAFYVRGLGFEIDWEWRHEPGFPVFMQVSRAGLCFYLSEHAGDCQPGGSVHLYVADVDVWHAEIAAAGVAVKQAPATQAWGNRDMVLIDPFGNRVVVAQRVAKAEVVSEQFSVRAYRPADRGALELLWQRVFPDDPPWNAPARMIDAKLKVQPELLLVGEQDAVIAGAVIAGYDGVRGWIHHLAVAPELRRRGFATQLMRAAEEGLRALGCTKINLQVRATNREVLEFYRSLGYAVEERVSMGRRFDG